LPPTRAHSGVLFFQRTEIRDNIVYGTSCSDKGKEIPQNKTKREQNTTYTWEVADDLKLAVNHMACLDQSIPRSFLGFHQPPCRHRENKSAQTNIRSSGSRALEERGKYQEKESSVHLLERQIGRRSGRTVLHWLCVLQLLSRRKRWTKVAVPG
jgi:hypothetical protein